MKEDPAFKTTEEKIAFIESVLFVSKEPVEPEKLIDFIRCSSINDFEKLLIRLKEKYEKNDSGLVLNRTGGGLQLSTKLTLHSSLKAFFTVRSSSKLTIPSLETLSIVAYRQPVTLAEISALRDVNSIGPVKNLLQKNLIKISGRKKTPGLPALYSTTKEFLIYFGLNDLSELPSLEELTEMFEEKEQPSLFK